MRVAVTLARLAFALAVASSIARAQSVPDRILTGGRIFTSDSTKPWAEAIAIRGERIVAVGTNAAITKLAGPKTRRVALGGRVVVPGFNDAHVHVGSVRTGVTFSTSAGPTPDPSFKQVFDSVAAIAARVPPGTWISGTMASTILDDITARRGALDRAAPRNPVMLEVWTGHGTLLNSAALHRLGIDDDVRDPLGGRFERERGKVTGLLEEYAGWNLRRAMNSRQPDAEIAVAFQQYASRDLTMGITSFSNMADALTPAKFFRVLTATPLPLRVRIIPFPATNENGRDLASWRTMPAHLAPMTTVSGMKYILDGTPIERLELMRRPYMDKSGWYGRADFPLDTIRAMLREALAGSQQLILHISGDSLVRFVTTAMRTMAPDSVWRRKRLRIEHGDGIAPDVQPIVRQLGIVVVVNPTHFAIPALIHQRFEDAVATNYSPMRSLIAGGIPVAIGSDGTPNPLLNVMLATQNPNNPREAVTREQAVRAYTWGSAYAEFAEREKGTLAPGMLADLAVLSQDIFSVPSEQLPATTSVLTIVGGKVVYDAKVLGAKP